jgi:ABC-type amino acid transport substrate-binding protein
MTIRLGSVVDGGAVRRWTALLLASALVGSLATGCSARPRVATTLPAALRVGTTPIFPPLTMKQHGKLAGVEVDFANLLGQQLGVEVSITELPWTELIPALVDGKIDVIMSGMSITPSRTRYVDFTVPYMTVGQMAVVRKDDQPRLRDQRAMDQPTSRVGVLQNTTGDYFARRSLKQARVVGLVTVDDGIAALRAGDIDFFLSDAPTIWEITAPTKPDNFDLAGIYRPLTTEYLAWAVRQEDQSLRHQLNTTVLLWEQNGQLEDIIDDWVRTRRVTLQMK